MKAALGRYAPALAVALFVGGYALAAVYSNQDVPWNFRGGVYVAPVTVAATSSNKVTRMLGATFDYDFPSIAPQYVMASTGKTLTLTGAKLGDPCFLGVAAATPSDAGSAYIRQAVYTCATVADNLIELRAGNFGGDAGALDPPDAGFNVRVISNQ